MSAAGFSPGAPLADVPGDAGVPPHFHSRALPPRADRDAGVPGSASIDAPARHPRGVEAAPNRTSRGAGRPTPPLTHPDIRTCSRAPGAVCNLLIAGGDRGSRYFLPHGATCAGTAKTPQRTCLVRSWGLPRGLPAIDSRWAAEFIVAPVSDFLAPPRDAGILGWSRALSQPAASPHAPGRAALPPRAPREGPPVRPAEGAGHSGPARSEPAAGDPDRGYRSGRAVRLR